MKWLWWILGAVVLAVVAVWLEPNGSILGKLRGEPFFLGRTGSHWSRTLAAENPVKKEAAIKALGEGGADSVPVLEFLLRQQSADAEVRWTAAELLGKLGSAARPAAPALIAALEDSDQHVRSVSATSLSTIEAPAADAVGPLAKLLDREATVPTLRALSVFGPDAAPALPKLLAILNDQSIDPEIRWNAARTIGKMHVAAAAAIPDLIVTLEDPADRLREHSAEALGDIGPEAASAVAALTKTLQDPYVKARRDSVRSLGQIGPAARASIPEIEKLLKDPEAIVRDATKTTLERLKEAE